MIEKWVLSKIKIKNLNSVPTYQNALNNSNFKHMLKNSENKNLQTKKKKNRLRKIIYFNQLFCQSVRENILPTHQ